MPSPRFLSLFSGIEAASVAWEPLGFECAGVAEVEPFCVDLLRQRFPSVPNLGDVTAPDFIERAKALGPIDLIVGGSPCQSFSVAGLRKGMDDDRGNLALRFVEVVNGIDPDFTLWENVPGVLSDRTNGFGCLLGALVGADASLVPMRGQRWTDAGLVAGPRRVAAWRCLDAQFFGLAQRRKRVFVLAGRGAGAFRVAPVLLEREGVCRDPPTRRAKGEGVAADVAPSLRGRSNDSHREDSQAHVACTLRGGSDSPRSHGKQNGTDRTPLVACFGGGNTGGAIDVTTAVATKTRIDFDHETFVAHSLRADGFDASEDGTGRGTPLVPVTAPCLRSNVYNNSDPTMEAQMVVPIAFHENQRGELTVNDTIGALKVGGVKPGQGYPAVAFSSKDHGADAGEVAPTLRAAGYDGSHANGGAPPAVAFQEAQTGVREYAEAGSLRANGPGHDPVGTRVREGMAVRRLTPRECERLQGFPDDWTLVEVRGKPAADGPRYKAIGNSMAVPVMGWIGERILGPNA